MLVANFVSYYCHFIGTPLTAWLSWCVRLTMCRQMLLWESLNLQLSHKKNGDREIPRHSHTESRPDEDTPSFTHCMLLWNETKGVKGVFFVSMDTPTYDFWFFHSLHCQVCGQMAGALNSFTCEGHTKEQISVLNGCKGNSPSKFESC